MRLFHWLSRRTKANRSREGRDADDGPPDALGRLRCDLERLHERLNTVDIALRRHDDQLVGHEARLQEHGQKLQTLEEKVAIPAGQSAALRQASRHAADNSLRFSPQPFQARPGQQFGIEQFTEQQKRLLAVFFQNKGQWMSYADVGRVLNKSAATIKNQMNQIRQKADLFDRAVGNQSRNLFALKADLRVEKYLKVGQPIERPVPLPERDQSEVEPQAKEAEPVVEYAQERSEPEEGS